MVDEPEHDGRVHAHEGGEVVGGLRSASRSPVRPMPEIDTACPTNRQDGLGDGVAADGGFDRVHSTDRSARSWSRLALSRLGSSRSRHLPNTGD